MIYIIYISYISYIYIYICIHTYICGIHLNSCVALISHASSEVHDATPAKVYGMVSKGQESRDTMYTKVVPRGQPPHQDFGLSSNGFNKVRERNLGAALERLNGLIC